MSPDAYHLGLVGWPVEHSYSPRLHAAALSALGLRGDYRLFPVQPGIGQIAELETLICRLRDGDLQGLNVTLPYKSVVLTLANRLTPTAAAIGAVNTLFLEEDRVVGDNTDAPGFLADVKRQFPDLFEENREKTALVLGAGGAARAVVYALCEAGWQVIVAARRIEQAEALVKSFGPSTNSGHEYTNVSLPARHSCIRVPIRGRLFGLPLNARSLQADIQPAPVLIVNATSAGMSPHIQETPWPAGVPLPPGCAVYDLVYNPQETALVRQARASGLPAATGGGMLVEQAALSFERWTGRSAPREIMQQALEKELNKP